MSIAAGPPGSDSRKASNIQQRRHQQQHELTNRTLAKGQQQSRDNRNNIDVNSRRETHHSRDAIKSRDTNNSICNSRDANSNRDARNSMDANNLRVRENSQKTRQSGEKFAKKIE